MADQTEQPPVESGAPAEATPDVDPVDPGESTELDDAVAPGKDEDILSKKVTLADLSAKGATLYAHKNYEEAAEIFSEASVLQAEINGETAPENAEVLFHYGRSLFKVGQSKSDVLGGSAPDAKPPKGNALPKPAATGDKTADEKASSSKEDAADKGPSANKPLFQFTGDEHLDGSDDDDEVLRPTVLPSLHACTQLTTPRRHLRRETTRKRTRMISQRPLRSSTSHASATSSAWSS